MKSRSAKRGARTLAPEVTSVSKRGLCLLLDGREQFLDFKRFPWFREATVRSVFKVSRPSHDHLRWAELDVDIELDSLAHPERYPLVSRQQPPAAVRDGSASGRVATAVPAPIMKRAKAKPRRAGSAPKRPKR